MNTKSTFSLRLAAGIIAAVALLSSCNKDSDTETFVPAGNLAVTAFSLSADIDNPGLDSAYFAIDLNHGIIFNADSLRKGTRINKVVPKITFNSTVKTATIEMTGGTTREGTVDFQANPTDSIDFTGSVVLHITGDDDRQVSYRIKVNVHKETPDTLVWGELAHKNIVSRLPNPKSMKTISVGARPAMLVEESDGTYSSVVYASAELDTPVVTSLTLPFSPRVRTLTATDSKLLMLADDGTLWEGSSDFRTWTATSETWDNLIGAYGNSVVGIRTAGGNRVFAQYPDNGINARTLPAGFPLEGFSNFVTLSNKWTLSPVAFFTGGVKPDGTYSDATWAFDGTEWIILSEGGIPALSGASLIPYYNFRPSADGKSMIEYPVWMLLGGADKSGNFNRTVYVSYDNAVNWTTGTRSLQLPAELPGLVNCDNLVVNFEKQADLSAGWTRHGATRANYWVNDGTIYWECPYIFLFGGRMADGNLSNRIWRGVLNRLTFTPII